MTEKTSHIIAVAKRIKPLLADEPAEVQGAALADLLAIWLAGHEVSGNPDATRTLRAELLAEHCRVVRQLVPVNARIIGTEP